MLADADISVAEIAKRLGISRTGFYNHFPAARQRSIEAQKGKAA